MGTRAYSARIPDDLKQAVDKAVRDQTVRSFSEAVNAALEEWLGRAECATCATAAMAVREAQAELAEARSELARVSAELARLSGTPAGSGNRFADAVTKEQALAAYLAAATGAVPATPLGASVMSGYTRLHVQSVLTAMTRLGYLDKPGYGKYVPVPGADMTAGVPEALREVSAAGMARKAAGAAKATSPPAAPAGAAAGRTAPSGGKSAAREKNGSAPGTATLAARPGPPGKRAAQRAVREAAEEGSPRREPVLSVAARPDKAAAVAGLRDRVPGLVTASELPAAPVFRAGPDVDCLHENMRAVKGVCPDCKQWVGRKP